MVDSCHIYISNCINPAVNLAFENWLFRYKLIDKPILFLWQNKPSIIIGRAQNPWVECNIAELAKDDIPIYRRQSGGGTVYHDLGNLNYTILAPNKYYHKIKNLELIVMALTTCNIKAIISPRNDILVKAKDGLDYKISGSAFRETKHKSFHHGTLLINADTRKIPNYLHHTPNSNIKAKGVNSVRSKVVNLQDIEPSISIENCKSALQKTFSRQFKLKNEVFYFDEKSMLDISEVAKESFKLTQWDWRFAKTLPFEHKITISILDQIYTLNLSVKHGQVDSIKIDNRFDENTKSQLESFFQDKPKYNKDTFLTKAHQLNTDILEQITSAI